MSMLWWVVVVTAIAGVLGTGLGGLFGAVLRRDSTHIVSLLLAFAGGVMMAVVCFDMLPDAFLPEGAVKDMPLMFVLCGVILGFVLVYLLNYLIDRTTNPELAHIDSDHPQTADDLDELIHADHYSKHRASKTGSEYELFLAGVVMACAIALHNMPEGMVIGASYAREPSTAARSNGLMVALVIGLHNIPEGMSVSVPLISGGMPRWRAVAVTALSGAPTILGAVLGYLLGVLSPVWLCLALSFASGAMLYVVFCELLPESYLMWKSKAPGVFTLIGVLVGVILVRV